VASHVLDAAGDGQVVGAKSDPGSESGHGGHGAGAHPVNGESGYRLRQPRKQCRRATEREALVAGLGGGGNRHLVDAFPRDRRVAFQQSDHGLDHEIIRPGVPVNALFTSASERGANPVYKHDFCSIGHFASINRSGVGRS